jgi:hypothetical protein
VYPRDGFRAQTGTVLARDEDVKQESEGDAVRDIPGCSLENEKAAGPEKSEAGGVMSPQVSL